MSRHFRSSVAALLILCTPGSSGATRPAVVHEGVDRYALGPHLECLENRDKRWTIADVSSGQRSSSFRKCSSDVPNYGMSPSAFWFRFTVRSRDSEGRRWLLEVANPPLDRIEVYFERQPGSFDKLIGGDKYPFAQRVIKHRNFVFPIDIIPGRTHRVYLRVEGEGSLQVPLILWSQRGLFERSQTSQVVLGLLYGLLVVMIFYNLFLFWAVRDRSYLYYVLFVASQAVNLSTFHGLAQQYLWPSSTWWATQVLTFSIYSSCLWAALFAKEFLSTKKYFPGFNTWLTVWAGGCFLGGVLSLFVSYSFGANASAVTTIITCLTSILVGAFSFKRGLRPARYFLLAWSVFLVGAILISFNRMGILPRTMLTENGPYVGLAIMVILLSLALADRINLINKEKEQAQAEALEVQRQAAETLEQEVQNRTQELKQAYERLAEHDKLKSRFFSNVSHELRTPLTLILTPLERLLAGEAGSCPQTVKDHLRSMVGNTQRLLRLVNQLLDLSRLESGAEVVAYELCDVRSLVEPLVQGFIPFARSKGVEIELRGPEEIPEIYADPAKLDKVLSNLLSNACKFTDTGGAIILRLSKDESSVKVAVKDSGIGIAEEDLPRIFERFRQLDDGASRKYEGTGIGLALSKELVELMGGSIDLISEPGLGSTFTVNLPRGKEHIADPERIRTQTRDRQQLARARADAVALTAEVGMQDSSPGQTATREAQDASKPLVLVVEDNPDMRSLIRDICQRDLRVLEAEDGQKGLEMIENHRPALVISDIMMPQMDGHELLHHVRSSPAISSTPVILLTAKAGPETRLEGLQAGADDYITKPFDSRELLARAKNLIRLQEQESELRKLNTQLQREVVEQATALERSSRLQRYLPPDVVREIIEEGAPVQVGQQRRRLTAFRLELLGLSEIIEAAEDVLAPEDLATMLNGYLSEMIEVAFAHGATVDRFVRDTVVGFFGAPTSEGPEQDAIRCARMARQMWQRAVDVCERWRGWLETRSPLPTLVLASGYATVGNFGSSRRVEYTALGGPVDEVETLLLAAEPGTVTCGHSTWVLIQDEVQGEPTGEVTVKKYALAVKLYRLAGPCKGLQEEWPADTISQPDAEIRAARRHASLDSRELSEGIVLAERYRIIRRLGTGGTGTVYQARDLKLDSDVAVKLVRHDLRADPEHQERLYREVKLARLISHANVAACYNLEEWGGHEFICMEYIQGSTLSKHIEETGALTLSAGQRVLQQLCEGLSAAHAVNIIHCDLKPANIMLEPGGRVAIMDFGIARWFSGLKHSGSDRDRLVGTPYYMAPEQIEGRQLDHRADIYSLGVVAFEMFTGLRPFEAETAVGLAYQHIHHTPSDPQDLNSDLPPRIAAVILRCMEKAPEARFGSVMEIASLL